MKRIVERDTSSTNLKAVLGVGDRVASKSKPLKGTVYTLPGSKVAVSWDDKTKSSPADIKDLDLIDEMIKMILRGKSTNEALSLIEGQDVTIFETPTLKVTSYAKGSNIRFENKKNRKYSDMSLQDWRTDDFRLSSLKDLGKYVGLAKEVDANKEAIFKAFRKELGPEMDKDPNR